MIPKISVIIPVYNLEEYIEETLNCIVNQTFKEIEIICVDDGSTDNTLNILNKYAEKDDRFIILRQENKYAGVARNAGIKIAKGEYLSFLDGDDLFDLDMLFKMYNKAKNDKSDVVVCEFCRYNSATKLTSNRSLIRNQYLINSPFPPERFDKVLFSFASLNAWTKLFKRNLFVDNKIQFSSTFCCNDVAAVCTALACSSKISTMHNCFVKYRVNHKINISSKRKDCAEGFLIAAQDLQNNLKRLNLYDKYIEAYKLRMRASYKWELSLCSDEQKEKRKQFAKENVSDELYYILYNEEK